MEKSTLLDEITRAITDDVDETPTSITPQKALPPIYYDGRNYHIPTNSGGWVSVDRQSVRQNLIKLGFNSRRGDDPQSEVDVVILRIQTENNVSYVGSLAGHPAGIHSMNGVRVLATSSPVFVEPKPGEFSLVLGLIQKLLGETQLTYFYAWLKVSIEMYRARAWQPGQVLALCGPVGAGKNLLRLIVTALLGGRVAFPHANMIGQTNFNSDLFSAETLAIEDEQESADIRTRRKFGAAIKSFAVNQDQRCEGKNREPMTLRVFRRLIISMNDDAERIQVLPPLDEDIADKLMVFKVEAHPMPMPTRTASDKAAFWKAIEDELPMLVNFLDEWEVPEDLRDERYGVRYYHHPDLKDQLNEMSPEGHLSEMIEMEIFQNNATKEYWEGTASELQAALLAEGSSCSTQARKVLTHQNNCGTYLGRLQRKGTRVSRHTMNGRTIWKIMNFNFVLERAKKDVLRRERGGSRSC